MQGWEQPRGMEARMAARLTERQKKKIVADYLESGNYRATARKNNVNPTTVKRVIAASDGFEQKAVQKKEEIQADVLAYMDSQRQVVCEIIGKGLTVLNDPEKLKEATPAQITTAIGTLIDKWTQMGRAGSDGGGGVVLIPEIAPEDKG
jgi:transposase-like protein